jgi:hypothetical protein
MMMMMIVMRVYRLDGRGSISSRGKRFSFLDSGQTGSGTHPAYYPMGNGGSLPGRGMKRPGD